MKPEFSGHICRKIFKYQISRKFHPVGAELFHVNGQVETHGRTDMKKLIIEFEILERASPYVQYTSSVQQTPYVTGISVVTSRSARQATLPTCSGRRYLQNVEDKSIRRGCWQLSPCEASLDSRQICGPCGHSRLSICDGLNSLIQKPRGCELRDHWQGV
jgi:hypothetical protein